MSGKTVLRIFRKARNRERERERENSYTVKQDGGCITNPFEPV